jgi:hypothetical protein
MAEATCSPGDTKDGKIAVIPAIPGARKTDFRHPPVLFRVVGLLFLSRLIGLITIDLNPPCAHFGRHVENAGVTCARVWWILISVWPICTLAQPSAGSVLRKTNLLEALSSRNFSNLNVPAAFSWLDLQEVSQSCPAETLFK